MKAYFFHEESDSFFLAEHNLDVDKLLPDSVSKVALSLKPSQKEWDRRIKRLSKHLGKNHNFVKLAKCHVFSPTLDNLTTLF